MTTNQTEDDVLWLPKEPATKSEQWHYHHEPCTVLAVGIRKGEKTPCVMRVALPSGEEVEVWSSERREFPGLSFSSSRLPSSSKWRGGLSG